MYCTTRNMQKQYHAHELYDTEKYSARARTHADLWSQQIEHDASKQDIMMAQTFMRTIDEVDDLSSQIMTAVVPCNTKQYVILQSEVYGDISLDMLYKLCNNGKYFQIYKITHGFEKLDYTLLYQHIQFGRFLSGVHTIQLHDDDLNKVADLFLIERALIRQAYLHLDVHAFHALTNKVLLDQCMYSLMAIPCLAYGYDSRHVSYVLPEHKTKQQLQLNYNALTQQQLKQYIVDFLQQLNKLLLRNKGYAHTLKCKIVAIKPMINDVEVSANIKMRAYRHTLKALERGDSIVDYDADNLILHTDAHQDACLFLSNTYKSKLLLVQKCISRLEQLLYLGSIWTLNEQSLLCKEIKTQRALKPKNKKKSECNHKKEQLKL